MYWSCGVWHKRIWVLWVCSWSPMDMSPIVQLRSDLSKSGQETMCGLSEWLLSSASQRLGDWGLSIKPYICHPKKVRVFNVFIWPRSQTRWIQEGLWNNRFVIATGAVVTINMFSGNALLHIPLLSYSLFVLYSSFWKCITSPLVQEGGVLNNGVSLDLATKKN